MCQEVFAARRVVVECAVDNSYAVLMGNMREARGFSILLLLPQEPRERCCSLVNCGELVGVVFDAEPY